MSGYRFLPTGFRALIYCKGETPAYDQKSLKKTLIIISVLNSDRPEVFLD